MPFWPTGGPRRLFAAGCGWTGALFLSRALRVNGANTCCSMCSCGCKLRMPVCACFETCIRLCTITCITLFFRYSAKGNLVTKVLYSFDSRLSAGVCHAQAVVRELWWTKHGSNAQEAAREPAMEAPRYDAWELDTALQLANMLLLPASSALYKRLEAG